MAMTSVPKKIMTIVGTRPEAIKMAPIIRELKHNAKGIETIVCSTGQHKEMLSQAFADFGLVPDVELALMSHNQGLAQLSARLFTALDELFGKLSPDAVLVQGDTTTVQIAATVAFYRNIRIGHVEAGLRSHDMRAPFPEEFNRRVCGLVADWHFAPTPMAKGNLVAEGIPEKNILVTGNTVIDALLWMRGRLKDTAPELPPAIANAILEKRTILLATGHRRENFGGGLLQILSALRELAARHPDLRIVYPVHLNPNVHDVVHEQLGTVPGILLCEPLSYTQLVYVMDSSYFIITDSGGIQEEGPAIGKPVIVTRDVTERPEGVEAGVSILAGPHKDALLSHAEKLLNDKEAYSTFSQKINPYGDGSASWRIVRFLSKQMAFTHASQETHTEQLA